MKASTNLHDLAGKIERMSAETALIAALQMIQRERPDCAELFVEQALKQLQLKRLLK